MTIFPGSYSGEPPEPDLHLYFEPREDGPAACDEMAAVWMMPGEGEGWDE